MKSIRIAEIFGPTIQGEGPVAGRPSIFVRTAGCDLRCVWCDSMFAVDAPLHHQSWRTMSTAEIADEVRALDASGCFSVTLTGGNPALQPLGDLATLLRGQGREVFLETQGTIIPDWLGAIDMIIVSPKGPSSRMDFVENEFLAFMQAANASGAGRAVLKVVVGDDADLDFAERVGALAPDNRLYVQPCNENPDATDPLALIARYRWLMESVLARGCADITVLPQLHALAWGGARGR